MHYARTYKDLAEAFCRHVSAHTRNDLRGNVSWLPQQRHNASTPRLHCDVAALKRHYIQFGQSEGRHLHCHPCRSAALSSLDPITEQCRILWVAGLHVDASEE